MVIALFAVSADCKYAKLLKVGQKRSIFGTAILVQSIAHCHITKHRYISLFIMALFVEANCIYVSFVVISMAYIK